MAAARIRHRIDPNAAQMARSAVTRRAFVFGTAVGLLFAACHAPSAKDASVAIEPTSDPAFLNLSKTLTGYADLDPLTAARISQGFSRLFPDVKSQFAALEGLARVHPALHDLMAAATAQGLDEAALSIIAAWYTGTVGKGDTAVSTAYAEALMNRPVAGVVAPPTYELGGPGWWTADPPPVGVSPPVERTSIAPAAPKAKTS